MPKRIKNFALIFAEIGLGMTMAIKTPSHVKRVALPSQRHLADGAVTGRAADALRHMDAVIEVDEIGKIVHAIPFNGLAGSSTLTHRFKHRRIAPNLRMAIHAGAGRRYAGKSRFFNRRMAIPAIYA